MSFCYQSFFRRYRVIPAGIALPWRRWFWLWFLVCNRVIFLVIETELLSDCPPLVWRLVQSIGGTHHSVSLFVLMCYRNITVFYFIQRASSTCVLCIGRALRSNLLTAYKSSYLFKLVFIILLPANNVQRSSTNRLNFHYCHLQNIIIVCKTVFPLLSIFFIFPLIFCLGFLL